MLRKLMKHEFRATGRIMLPLYAIMLILSVFANGSIRILGSTDNRFLNILGGLIMVLFVVGITAVCIMTLVLMINRFRTNLLGDEGYVMLTLPASMHQQVWSKIIVSVVWFAATAVGVGLACLIAAFRVDFIRDIIEVMQEIFAQLTAYTALNGSLFLVESLILCFVGIASCCLQFYASMAVGYSFAAHKTLLSVVFFFVFQFALQFLGLTGAFSFEGFNFGGAAAVHAVLWIFIAISAVTGAVFYIITTQMLQKRLNLE
jgi:hypothetical protein